MIDYSHYVFNLHKLLKTLENNRHEYKTRFEMLEETLDPLLKQNRGHASHTHQQHGQNENGSTTSQQSFQVRNIKLDFPKFDGLEVL